jgi:hypothetical protein
MSLSCELKLRDLAQQNAQLQTDLGTPMRWLDRQLVQGDLGKPSDNRTCVTVRRVSTLRDYNQGGLMTLSQPRLQIDVYSYNAETARQVASHIAAFMNSVSLCDAGEWASPQTGPNQAPNYLLNERAGMLYALQPPAYVETQDWRVFNREDIP